MSDPSVEWSAVIFVNRRGEVLLNLRDDKPEIDYPNWWDFIGGGIETGESADQALVREVMEETGQRLSDCTKFSVDMIPLDLGGLARAHTYYAPLNKEASELLLGEGQEHRFFAPSELEAIRIVPYTELILCRFLLSPEYERCRRADG